jgi:hypothetical protein
MKILGVIVLVLLGIYGFYTIAMPSVTMHYKLTLVVDDNGKQYTGYSVVEVYRQDTTKVFGSSFGGYGYKVKGEAVAVDLGKKGVLFALLKGDQIRNPEHYGYSEPQAIALRAFSKAGYVIDDLRHLNQYKPKTNLDFSLLPMLVRFRDINDPKTVEHVDPYDLEKTFGSGVKLVSAEIEITDSWVTSGIENIISKSSWKEHGYAEWKASLPYGNPLRFDWENFKRNY